jgi:solute carrier family 6 amino acid transporter-like protein 5/7/9/14
MYQVYVYLHEISYNEPASGFCFSGLGFGQMFCTILVLTYYCSLMALTVFFFLQSFASDLPWSTCDKEWDMCINSGKGEYNKSGIANVTGYKSSSELYF